MHCAHRPHSPRPPGPAVRTLHLVDIENLCGGRPSQVSREHACQTLGTFCRLADYVTPDLMMIGCSPRESFLFGCRDALPKAPVWLRRGVDGGERAIIDQLSDKQLGRFQRVVIGSGDGRFAAVARKVRASGGAVSVVALAECTSASLLRSVDSFVPMPEVAA